jgi:uncharacterized protein (TIGR02246 family)
MMKRVVILTVAATALAVPGFAQQSPTLSEQQKQAVQTGIDKYVKAYNAKDARGLAALYDENGMIVGSYLPQPLSGRAAIEKYLTEAAKQGQFASNLSVEPDWKATTSLGNNLILVTGTWADTLPTAPVAQAGTTPQSGSSQSPSQLSHPPGEREHGSWAAIDEMRGGEVLIRMLSYNIGVAAPTK